MTKLTIAIDAMGGDYGCSVTVPACLQVLAQYPELHLILVGNQEAIEKSLANAKANLSDRLIIHHTTQEVAMNELPSQALRGKKDSSMRVAINLVKEKTAQACVSAGNTGALMATAHFVLKSLPGIDRPALMATFPTANPERKEVRVLDLGANVDSNADNLYQFAIMGSVVASAIDHIPQPKVALLNIGEEEIKGNDLVKQAASLLTNSKDINYAGYIEADAIFSGTVDVIVCDGFVGNVALKSSEGIIRFLIQSLKKEFMKNPYTKLIGFLAKPMLKAFAKALDPGRHNGATLLGLQGIVIKSHGGANIAAFANAIEEAVREVKTDILERIHKEVGILLEETGE